MSGWIEGLTEGVNAVRRAVKAWMHCVYAKTLGICTRCYKERHGKLKASKRKWRHTNPSVNGRSSFLYRVYVFASSSINWCEKSVRIKVITGIWNFHCDSYRSVSLIMTQCSAVIRGIFPALRRYLPLPSVRSRYFGVEGMSPTLREFSTRHCLICQFNALGRLGVTPEFGTTAKETPALMVLCVTSDESGHAGKMRSFLTTFIKRQYHTSCKCCIGISELNPPTAITVKLSVQCYVSIPSTIKVYITTNTTSNRTNNTPSVRTYQRMLCTCGLVSLHI